jgi:hypothetical protein
MNGYGFGDRRCDSNGITGATADEADEVGAGGDLARVGHSRGNCIMKTKPRRSIDSAWSMTAVPA